MELYALDRSFQRQHTIDEFVSAIWTERFFGDDDFEIVVPPTFEMYQKLAPGTLMEEADSDIPMIVEDAKIENGLLTATGISLTSWMNNRFVRSTAYPGDNAWDPGEVSWSPGFLIATIFNYWVTGIGSPFLVDAPHDGSNHLTVDPGDTMGIFDASNLAIPNLTVVSYDDTLAHLEDISVPYGPVYDVIKSFAQPVNLGLKIKLESVSNTGYALGFYVYLGKDRTSGQTVNPVVRFSPLDNSLVDIKRLDSMATSKTVLFGYGPQVNDDAATYYTTPSIYEIPTISGFDLRAAMVAYDDITQEMLDPAGGVIDQGLAYGSRIAQKLYKDWVRLGGKTDPYRSMVSMIDGLIIPNDKLKYGVHFGLGDTIEMEAFEDVITKAIVTEYIRSQDAAGYKEYPAVSIIE